MLESLVNEIIDFVSDNLISTGFVVNLFLILVNPCSLVPFFVSPTSILTRAAIYSILSSDLPLNRTEIPIFPGFVFGSLSGKGLLKSGLGLFCLESHGDSNGIKSRFLPCFVHEIIGVGNREISRKHKVFPFQLHRF